MTQAFVIVSWYFLWMLLQCWSMVSQSVCVLSGSPPSAPEGASRRLLLYQHCIPLCESGDLQTEVASDIIGLLMLEVQWYLLQRLFCARPLIRLRSFIGRFIYSQTGAGLFLPFLSCLNLSRLVLIIRLICSNNPVPVFSHPRPTTCPAPPWHSWRLSSLMPLSWVRWAVANPWSSSPQSSLPWLPLRLYPMAKVQNQTQNHECRNLTLQNCLNRLLYPYFLPWYIYRWAQWGRVQEAAHQQPLFQQVIGGRFHGNGIAQR